MSLSFGFLQTPSGVILTFAGRTPIEVHTESPHYRQVVQFVKEALGSLGDIDPNKIEETHPRYAEVVGIVKKLDEQVENLLFGKARRVTEELKDLADRGLSDSLTISGGCVRYKGEPVNGEINRRILRIIEEGFPLASMVSFCDNLYQNPSMRSVEQVYPFMLKGNMAITLSGMIQVYKVVDSEYYSKHQGAERILNQVGKPVSMPRNRVCDDPDQACAAGLHVCSYGYIKTFYSPGDRVLLCEVNPKDVVSVPTHHDCEKMRVCDYRVVADITDAYINAGECILSSVAVDTGVKAPFELTLVGSCVGVQKFGRLVDAKAAIAKAFEDKNVESACVLNTTTGAVVLKEMNPAYASSCEDDVEDDEELDDEDEDLDDTDDGETYELVLFRTAQDLAQGRGEVHDIEPLGLSEAMSLAIGPRFVGYHLIQIRSCETKEIKRSIGA